MGKRAELCGCCGRMLRQIELSVGYLCDEARKGKIYEVAGALDQMRVLVHAFRKGKEQCSDC